MTPHDPQTLIEEPLTHQAPTGQILVWRRPKLLWFAIIAVFGLALPGFVLSIIGDPFGPVVALPAASVATFVGIFWIERRTKPLESYEAVASIFFKCGGVLILGLPLILGLFFPILPLFLSGLMVGLIYGLPWAALVSIITTSHAMVWSERP